MSARKQSPSIIETTRPLYADAIDAVLELALTADSSPSQLSAALRALSQRLENLQYAALALIAETAADSGCRLDLDPHELRDSIVDLCERLLISISTAQPFDFREASPTLMALLFVDEPDSGPVDPPTATNGTEVCTCSDRRLVQDFVTECLEHQTHAEHLMLILESEPQDHNALHGLFRAVHSLKGASGVCDVHSLGRLAHLSESLLVRVRDGRLVLESTLFGIILLSIDFMGRQLRALQSAMMAGTTLHYPAPPATLWRALDAAVRTGTCTDSQYQAARAALEVDSAPVTEAQERRIRKLNGDSLRVDSKRLGLLIDLIGELVITETMVQRELDSRPSSTAISVGTRLRKVVREVQQLSLTLKMVPVNSLFQKLNRMVRDLSNKLDKPTELIIEGAETEVDKTLLEGITDPLMHLVRNALDHGIESTAERIEAGKPENATIQITAEHRSGNVLFTISDDGRGLDRDKILNRAIAQGLVSKDSSLSPRDIDRLIFSPGFSTVESATELSGRGVGMDVVRRNVESMRGAIQLEAIQGTGTTIRLELPLTLSIIDGTVIRVGSRCFIAPTLSVVEQVQASQLSFIHANQGEWIDYRGSALELLRLGEIVGVNHVVCSEKGQVCLIIETGDQRYGLIVDAILGQQPIVIKSLGEILENFAYYAGGALLGDGEIAFVLDLAALTKLTTSSTSGHSLVH